MMNKKWLIIYASAGQGHRRAGEALYNYIQNNLSDIEVKLIDALDFTNSVFKNLYKNGYAFLVKNLPLLWKISYIFSNFRFSKIIRFLVNRINTKRLENFIIEYQPDIILTTHFLPQEVASYLKKRRVIKSKLVVIITDFYPHIFWISDYVDKYMVASSDTQDSLITLGIEKDKILVTGIPVDLKFSLRKDKAGLYKKFDLKDAFTVLIVTAGFGLGPLEKIVKILYKEVQIIVICGYNQRLFKKLKKKYPQVKVFGFVENIDELMELCDIIITKPGGLTISEALIKELPMIFISPIFGQETENIKIMEKYGVGKGFRDIYSIKEFILRCKDNREILLSMKERISFLRKPYATGEIIDALC